MTEMPASNDIVTVGRANGQAHGYATYVDEISAMPSEELVRQYDAGVIPESVLLRHALYLLDESEARNAKCVAMLMEMEKKLSAMMK